MLRNLTVVLLVFYCVFSVNAQNKIDRAEFGYTGYVRSVTEETAQIDLKNEKTLETKRKLNSIKEFDISGRLLKFQTFTDNGDLLYADHYSYDSNGKLVKTSTSSSSKLIYLCDKKTFQYNDEGQKSEEICHLNNEGVIWKKLFRYNSEKKLSEIESKSIVNVKNYFNGHSLEKYKYDKNGQLEKISFFIKDEKKWKAADKKSSSISNLNFSNTQSKIITKLAFNSDEKLLYLTTSLTDDKQNELETITYLPDGSIKKGNRYTYQYDKHGNFVKKTEYEWSTIDGRSAFNLKEVTYKKIKYFKKKEIKKFEKKRLKNKSLNKPKPSKENLVLKNENKEEYAVYEELFRIWNKDKDIKKIVVEKFTKYNKLNDGNDEFFLSSLEIEKEIREDFIEKNKSKSFELQKDLFSKKSKVILIDDMSSQKIFNGDNGWKKFYKKYKKSQGMSAVSRVGFNKEKTKAIVYFGTQSDLLAGAGYIVTLRKTSNKWEIIKQDMLWIS